MANDRIRRTLVGLRRAINSLDGFQGRKSVVFYSEGFILSPQLRGVYEWIIDRCRRANIALFVAGAEGLRTGRPTAESRTGGLSVGPPVSPTLGVDVARTEGAGRTLGWLIDAETAGATHLAVATGGEAFFVNEATAAVARALSESTAYYLIGFQPAEGKPGERKLEVRVRGEGLKVRARTRYYWGAPLPSGNVDSATVVALRAMSDRDGVRFRVTVAEPQFGGVPAPARLRVELDPVGSRERRLKLLIEARPLRKGEVVHDAADLTVPVSDVPLSMERELGLAPGVWQARVVVRDEEIGALGSVLHTFEVGGRAVSPGGGAR